MVMSTAAIYLQRRYGTTERWGRWRIDTKRAGGRLCNTDSIQLIGTLPRFSEQRPTFVEVVSHAIIRPL